MSHFLAETIRKQVDNAEARVNSLLQRRPKIQLCDKGARVISTPERVLIPNPQQTRTTDVGAKTLHSHDLTSVLDWPGGSTLSSPGVGASPNIPDLTRVMYNPSSPVVFLMETKNNRNTLDRFRKRLQFPNSCYVDPIGLSGGLALWWKDEVDVEVRWKSKNIISYPFNGAHGPPTSALKWTSEVVDSLSKDEANATLSLAAFTAWFIWKARNNFIFRHAPVNPLETMSRANFARWEFSNSSVISSVHMDNHPRNDSQSAWKAPDCSSFKANCDVAIRPNSSTGVAAIVLRDWKGKVVEGIAKSFQASSPLQGELFAIREACLLMEALGLKGMEIESDNKEAIHLSVSELVPPWSVSALVLDIRFLARSNQLVLNWTPRSANKVAHMVAALASKGNLPCNWVSVHPSSLLHVLAADSVM
ncbi:hypothetical protein Vadar_002098 [Vaccinium darrowii]|uniref:Uncharacterized protein n=1 Tax=Vaccinium darrowii TaxID=229202 RepID=A0ACB7ZGW8_9ERIC|nr:hypothetical protein Vadar_002098 [Vaccinium darrowii]